MAKMSLTWHTHVDDRTCPICLGLDGYSWTFDNTREPFPSKLYSPNSGIEVWDCIRDEPRPHGDHIYNCRCWLTDDWDLINVEDRIKAIRARAVETCGSIEMWGGLGQVRVLRQQGRLVGWRKIV